MKKLILIIPCTFLIACAPVPEKESETMRAKETMETIFKYYSQEGDGPMKEYYPNDETYEVSYLSNESKEKRTGAFSYLWPYSSILSAATAILQQDPAFESFIESRILPVLELYFDRSRIPAAYASSVKTMEADRFYDDNIWIGIDLSELYLATGKPRYLHKAEQVWKFIESGTDEQLGGGIYWCEQDKKTKNTCSNAPAAVFALKLYQATKDRKYLHAGISLYEWVREHLSDEEGLYYDKMWLDERIDSSKFAYNSGEMIEAAALIYSVTGCEDYLEQAQKAAEACGNFFFEDFNPEGGTSFKILASGNIWFHAIMLRGLMALYEIDGNGTYVSDIKKTIDYAWENDRDTNGLFESDLKGQTYDEAKWLLTQGAMCEMYARIEDI